MAKEVKKKPQMPKGGRKGGAVFPRITLEQAVNYAKRLVSKTHTGPQSRDIIFSGVLGSKGGTGRVRISALKQYGFVKGDATKGYEASEPAKLIASSPPEELLMHYRAAVLRPRIFKALFDTYHGDTVSRAKLKQRVAALDVHPDLTDACVDNYLASAQVAGLVTADGDNYAHIPSAELSSEPVQQEEQDEDKVPGAEEQDDRPPDATDETQVDTETLTSPGTGGGDQASSSPRAIFNVNVNLDSSLDTEKLEKQLALLKKFGAI